MGSRATKITQFFKEVRIELRKVTWPSKKEIIGSTSVVILLVILIALFLGFVDLGISKMIRVFLS